MRPRSSLRLTVTPCHPDNIHFLERVISDQVERHLSGKAYERNTVIMRVRDPGDRVRRSRSARHKADADLSGGSRIALRFVDQRLFMAREDDMDIFLSV